MYIAIAVTIARRIHLFSSRTQKLSFATPKVLVGQLTGRIGSCRIQLRNSLVHTNEAILFLLSLRGSVATATIPLLNGGAIA